MNYVGKKVYHKAKFGRGVVITQDQNNHITTRLGKNTRMKMFNEVTLIDGE